MVFLFLINTLLVSNILGSVINEVIFQQEKKPEYTEFQNLLLYNLEIPKGLKIIIHNFSSIQEEKLSDINRNNYILNNLQYSIEVECISYKFHKNKIFTYFIPKIEYPNQILATRVTRQIMKSAVYEIRAWIAQGCTS